MSQEEVDKKQNVVQFILGLVTLALCGAITWLFTSVGESKHNDDIQNIHIEYLRTSDQRQWTFYDADQDRLIEDYKTEIRELKKEVEDWKQKANINQ